MSSELIHQLAATSTEARKILEKKYPHEFRKSGWYVDSIVEKLLAYYDSESRISYGFDVYGEWFGPKVRPNFLRPENSPAPPKLVEQRLIEEAKKRGLVDGTSHKWPDLESRDTVYPLSFDKELNMLCGGFGYAVFHDGQWAEVIKGESVADTTAPTVLHEGKIHEFSVSHSDDYDNTPRIKPEIFTPVKQTIDKVIDALTELKNQLP